MGLADNTCVLTEHVALCGLGAGQHGLYDRNCATAKCQLCQVPEGRAVLGEISDLGSEPVFLGCRMACVWVDGDRASCLAVSCSG